MEIYPGEYVAQNGIKKSILFIHVYTCTNYCIAGSLGEGKMFVVFVVEKQTTKYLPTKQLP